LDEPLTERNQPVNPDGKGYEEMKDDRIQKVERKNGRQACPSAFGSTAARPARPRCTSPWGRVTNLVHWIRR
jgi:hypothetical protein